MDKLGKFSILAKVSPKNNLKSIFNISLINSSDINTLKDNYTIIGNNIIVMYPYLEYRLQIQPNIKDGIYIINQLNLVNNDTNEIIENTPLKNMISWNSYNLTPINKKTVYTQTDLHKKESKLKPKNYNSQKLNYLVSNFSSIFPHG